MAAVETGRRFHMSGAAIRPLFTGETGTPFAQTARDLTARGVRWMAAPRRAT
jgi:hypothetical protein